MRFFLKSQSQNLVHLEICLGQNTSDWAFSSGVEAAEKILSMKVSQRPSTVFAFNDDLAYGCYSVFQNRGLSIPDDISIADFDNSVRFKPMFPPITTVDVNLPVMVDYAYWYLSFAVQGRVPRGPAKIQIDTTICDNDTIKKFFSIHFVIQDIIQINNSLTNVS